MDLTPRCPFCKSTQQLKSTHWSILLYILMCTEDQIGRDSKELKITLVMRSSYEKKCGFGGRERGKGCSNFHGASTLR